MSVSDATSSVQNETGLITDLVLKHPRDAFGDDARIEGQWRDLNFTGPPALARALAEYDRFQEILETSGANLRWLPAQDADGLDSIYVRDASIVCEGGVILCGMGKAQRAWEPAAQGAAFREWGVPIVGARQRRGHPAARRVAR
jgi:N-dimethylarginine dimethylaminohydrolase